jgi:hypothetical protein
MNIDDKRKYTQNQKFVVLTPEREIVVELLCILYGLYDAQRWMKHSTARSKAKSFKDLSFHLDGSVSVLEGLIKNYSSSADTLLSEVETRCKNSNKKIQRELKQTREN